MKRSLLLLVSMLAACSSETEEVKSKTCLTDIPSIVSIPAWQAVIGSDNAYREERPERRVYINGFDIDSTEVTNAQFAKFVEATGYVTSAENAQLGFGKAGGAVFMPPSVNNPSWWRFIEGANWKHPEGPESSIENSPNDPVVQISYNDAKAYADWVGRRLPSAVEWEYAARGVGKSVYIWGDERAPNGVELANTWQGAFPLQNTEADGYPRRAPVGCYPPNETGLYDMIGNVWEWTSTIEKESAVEPIYTIKGGSFLCAENYCARYRAAAKQSQEGGFTTNHIGFRTVRTTKS